MFEEQKQNEPNEVQKLKRRRDEAADLLILAPDLVTFDDVCNDFGNKIAGYAWRIVTFFLPITMIVVDIDLPIKNSNIKKIKY